MHFVNIKINENLLSKEDVIQSVSDGEAHLGCENATAEIIGIVRKTFVIGDMSFVCNFTVVKNLREKIILGLPFLEDHRARPNSSQ